MGVQVSPPLPLSMQDEVTQKMDSLIALLILLNKLNVHSPMLSYPVTMTQILKMYKFASRVSINTKDE